jgi:predicted metal-binding protein
MHVCTTSGDTTHLCSNEGCAILAECFSQLASKHRHTRFVKITSTDCIANFPDAKLPTVLLYHDGKCAKSFSGLTIWGGKRASAECARPQP